MNIVIWKYPVPTGDLHQTFTLDLHKGTQLLSVKWVRDEAVLYAQHDPTVEEIVTRRFVSLGTGAEFSLQGMYPVHIGTVVQETGLGTYVWHLYELVDTDARP